MLVEAYPTTVQKSVWTNPKEEYGSWKGIDFKSFYEYWHAQWHHLASVPMHREEKNRKKEGRKRTASSEDAIKEEEPARQGHLWQGGSHLKETGS